MSIFRKVKWSFLLLLIPLVLTLIWFRKGLLYAGGEEGIPFYNLSKTSELSSRVWLEGNGGLPTIWFLPRAPYFWFLSFLSQNNANTVLPQALTFLILMITATVSVYFLVRETVVSKLKLKSAKNVALLSGIFYLLNPYSMTQIWGRGLYTQFFGFALTPLFLLLVIRAINKKSLTLASLAVVVTFVFSPAFVTQTQVLVLWVPALLYLGFYLSKNKKNKAEVLSAILISVFIGVFFLLVHAWWIIPTTLFAKGQYSFLLESSEYNLGSLRGVSRQFPPSYVIRLIHDMYFFSAKLYGEIYSSVLFKLISWIIPIVSLFSISILKKTEHFKFYLFLFAVSLFISLGSNFPTGPIFEWLFLKISYLQSLRNPFEKFGLVFMLAYAPFFSLGTYNLASELSRNFSYKKNRIFLLTIGTIVVLVSGVYVWPMWTGHFAGGFKINPWIEVPEYYEEVDRWLSEKGADFRIIHVPLLPGDGVRYNWLNSYQGLEPSEYLFNYSSISRNVGVNKPFYNILLERFDSFQSNVFGPDPDTSSSDFRGNTLAEELAKLNIRYIVLHNDIDHKLAGSKSSEETEQFLLEQEKIQKVKSFGKLDIYEVDIPDSISSLYSPDIKIVYIKKNPTEYLAKVKNAKEPFDIYFLNLFNDGWEAYVDGKKLDNHYKVFSYANAWNIDKRGNFDILIKYAPQDSVILGTKITKITLLLVFTLLGIQLLRKKGKTNNKILGGKK